MLVLIIHFSDSVYSDINLQFVLRLIKNFYNNLKLILLIEISFDGKCKYLC